MALAKVLYVGQSVADALRDSIGQNLSRYAVDGFEDQVSTGDWSIPLSVEYDRDLLSQLNPARGSEAEIANSQLVWLSLQALTPSVACENRVWVRLSHVECIEFCRKRWLQVTDEQRLTQAIQKHFFAGGRTAWRDDHAISRLWWNSWIARRVFPEDPATALRLLLSKADIRLSLVERPRILSRVELASGLIRLMLREGWVTAAERNTRELMKVVNLMGAGVVFEAMNRSRVDSFLDRCCSRAQAVVALRKEGEP